MRTPYTIEKNKSPLNHTDTAFEFQAVMRTLHTIEKNKSPLNHTDTAFEKKFKFVIIYCAVPSREQCQNLSIVAFESIKNTKKLLVVTCMNTNTLQQSRNKLNALKEVNL